MYLPWLISQSLQPLPASVSGTSSLSLPNIPWAEPQPWWWFQPAAYLGTCSCPAQWGWHHTSLVSFYFMTTTLSGALMLLEIIHYLARWISLPIFQPIISHPLISPRTSNISLLLEFSVDIMRSAEKFHRLPPSHTHLPISKPPHSGFLPAVTGESLTVLSRLSSLPVHLIPSPLLTQGYRSAILPSFCYISLLAVYWVSPIKIQTRCFSSHLNPSADYTLHEPTAHFFAPFCSKTSWKE